MYEFIKKNLLSIIIIGAIVFGVYHLISGNVTSRKAEKQLIIAVEKQRDDIRRVEGILSSYEQLDSLYTDIARQLSELTEQYTIGLNDLRDSVESYRETVDRTIVITKGNADLITDSLELIDLIEKEMDKNSTDSWSD